MSRFVGILVALLVTGAMSVAAQTPAAPSTPSKTPAPPKPAEKDLTLNGCISRDSATPVQFTLAETGTGDKYRLVGRGIGKYAGRRVEIVGGPDRRRFTFRGGLLPSANVAAQAGALDPARAAIANQPGGGSTGTGVVPLPEFHVSRVRLIDGVCQ